MLTLIPAPAATAVATGTVCNAVASVNEIGPGAGGISGPPELRLVGAPVIGGPFAFRVSGGRVPNQVNLHTPLAQRVRAGSPHSL
ncbi:MAG: hypothetical protein KDC14_18790, partial [Planctomycetes bacterium]|nr:hypothetical protein [Planctomycetota bacterium]